MRSIIALSFLFILSACATPYQPHGYLGGYESQDLGHGKYLVSFYGNGYTSRGTTQAYAIRRAQEICTKQEQDFEIGEVGGEGVHNKVHRYATDIIVQCKPKAAQASTL